MYTKCAFFLNQTEKVHNLEQQQQQKTTKNEMGLHCCLPHCRVSEPNTLKKKQQQNAEEMARTTNNNDSTNKSTFCILRNINTFF